MELNFTNDKMELNVTIRSYDELVAARRKIDDLLEGGALFSPPTANAEMTAPPPKFDGNGFDFRNAYGHGSGSKAELLAIVRRLHPVHTRTAVLAVAESQDGTVTLDELKTRWRRPSAKYKSGWEHAWDEHLVAGITKATRNVTGDRKLDFFSFKTTGSRHSGDLNWHYRVTPECLGWLREIVAEHPELFEHVVPVT